MHKCIVCGNRSIYTNINRQGVRYHGFPKNENVRREWFKVLGIDHCHEWERICSDHFLEENYKTGKKRFLFPTAVPQPYNRNDFPSNYATQSNDVETGNNIILSMEQNIIREEHNSENASVNNFQSTRRTSGPTGNNEDMRPKNMLGHTSGSGLRCSIKNCFNRHSENRSIFSFPKNYTLRKKWIEKCGIKKDPAKAKSALRVCSTHFGLDCFKNTALKNRLKPDAVPSLFLNNAPDVLPVSVNEAPVLSTHGDQLISPINNEAAEQPSEEERNHEIDKTDNTSMIIDLTIDDSSNSSLPITLEPIEKRTSQCTKMDVCNTEDFTRDKHKIIFKMSKKVVLPSSFWKSEHLISQNSTGFYQRDTDDETVKKVIFYDNLVPTIQIYGKKYEFDMPITTMKQLDDLLEKLDDFEKCYGRAGFVFEQCIGYCENSSVNMCSGCQGLVKDQDLEMMKAKIEDKNNTMESFKIKIAEKKKTVLELRKKMAEIKKNQQHRFAL